MIQQIGEKARSIMPDQDIAPNVSATNLVNKKAQLKPQSSAQRKVRLALFEWNLDGSHFFREKH